jgi:phosphotriesterase-related protein
MAKINSITGLIDTNELGRTLMHEHVLICDWSVRIAYKEWFDCDELTRMAIREFHLAKEAGFNTVVDCTPINLGRDVNILEKVASGAEIQIVASTGFYCQEEPWMIGKPESELVKIMVSDIEKGMQGTGIKAGIIKVATDDTLGFTENNIKVLRAAAKAHLATGVPITTHSNAKQHTGLKQQDIFEEEGVNLKNVVIGHVGDSNDISFLEKVLGRGSFIGMDRFGDNNFNPLADRINTLYEMIKLGHANSIILSQDSDVFIDFGANTWEIKRQMTPENRSPEDRDLRYIDRLVLPELRNRGIAQEQIDTILVNNPKRVFEQRN